MIRPMPVPTSRLMHYAILVALEQHGPMTAGKLGQLVPRPRQPRNSRLSLAIDHALRQLKSVGQVARSGSSWSLTALGIERLHRYPAYADRTKQRLSVQRKA